MDFEWDEQKNEANIRKHGIRFEEAAQIFRGPVLTRIDDREDYDELRELSIGRLGLDVVVVVVHTDRDEVIRIISARLANRAERKDYDEHCKKITQ